MVFAEYQPSIQHRARDAMCQALTGIAHRDVDILSAGVPPDEAGVIDCIEYLPRPAMRLFAKARDQAAGPRFQLPETLVPSSASPLL